MQTRTHPAEGGNYGMRGYEFIQDMDLIGNAERLATQASALIDAPQCPAATTNVIMDASHMTLQVHETAGHPLELDRVLGTEASMAGTSFLRTDQMGNFHYGSEHVNLVADATIPGGNGSFGYDDEGVKAQRFDLVREGILTGFLTSRETAPALGQQSNGTMRADNWDRIPVVRMTNINLEPGDWSLDEMIRDTKSGIYMETSLDPSIDDKRFNFQFATEIAWEIKDGSLGQVLKNPTYTGNTPEIWRNCDAVANRDDWHMWGSPNCGKGEPGQGIRVGHGTSPARFRQVRVGVGSW